MTMAAQQQCSTCPNQATVTCSSCHKAAYCGKNCQRKHWRKHKKSCKSYIIKDIPGKGRGLVASREIESGQLILKETAAFVLDIQTVTDHLISETLNALDDNIKQRFRNLTTKDERSNETNEGKEKAIFYNNAINVDGNKYGLFLNIALVNHSCMPNAVWGSCEGTDSMELRAVRSIGTGVEITVNYIMDKSLHLDPSGRRMLLEKNWGFICSCSPCAGDKDGPLRRLLKELQKRMREKLCLSKFEDLYKLHEQKLSAVAKMVAYNHQEMLNCYQVHLVLGVISVQSVDCISRHLSGWRQLCERDGLMESKVALEDMARSFKEGALNHREEFFLPGVDTVRTEWVQWVYRKL